MAPSRSSQKQSSAKPQRGRPTPYAPQLQEEVIDPVWLLKALGWTVVAAVLCAWLALCLLYYVGSWQLVLRPSKAIGQTPASIGIPFEEVRFDAAETGQPRLTGWWIAAGPAQTGAAGAQGTAKYGADTVLFLHDGTGSLSAAVPTLGLVHGAGINVFALDYRGFGHSDASSHPTSETMTADASAAFSYLTGTRHVAPDHVVLYGAGLGGSLAVALAKTHPEIPALIVDNPDPDPTQTAVAAHRSGIVPIRLLYHEHFEIAGPLATLPIPKLLISGGPNAGGPARRAEDLQRLFRSAASPAFSLLLPRTDYQGAYTEGLTRFLDQYLPAAGGTR